MASISKEIYRPSAVVGKWYARVRGAKMPFAEVGNWTQAELDIKTKEDKLPDMTVLGGGTHSKIERVEGITLKVKTADLNLTTLARHLRGVIDVKEAGTVTVRTRGADEQTVMPVDEFVAKVVAEGDVQF